VYDLTRETRSPTTPIAQTGVYAVVSVRERNSITGTSENTKMNPKRENAMSFSKFAYEVKNAILWTS